MSSNPTIRTFTDLPRAIINQILFYLDHYSLTQIQLCSKYIQSCCSHRIWNQVNLIPLLDAIQFETRVDTLIQRYHKHFESLYLPNYECIQPHLQKLYNVRHLFNIRPMDHGSFCANFLESSPKLISVGWLTTASLNSNAFNLHKFKFLRNISIIGNLLQIENLISNFGEYNMKLSSLTITTNTIQLTPYYLIPHQLSLEKLKICINGRLKLDHIELDNQVILHDFEPMPSLKRLEFKVFNLFENLREFRLFNDLNLFLPELILQKFNTSGSIEHFDYQTDSWETPDYWIKPQFPVVTKMRELHLVSIKDHVDIFKFPNLTKLSLKHFKLDEAFLSTLSALPFLKSLEMSYFGRNRVEYKSEFVAIKSITELKLLVGSVTPKMISALNQWMPNLEIFTCSYLDAMQSKIDKSFKSVTIRELIILDNFKYQTPIFVKFIDKCKKLKLIKFSDKLINDQTAEKFECSTGIKVWKIKQDDIRLATPDISFNKVYQ
ncbi:hypothetical protein CONCODRAFT_78924 [Conidiobolus coronatus NRRL 28638]|uniref:F-box domain-containing protein n=1 Tax=Conidiobolus coronatus (strain ATCC 28846 / CBS 209.66 / NRRL 28638) TaxID=796925 RepID=A0A137P5V1_CONC2|nr:hypothetical protein CONCODRAFT_78924 [Conidiobolus coronatus NRRL 28638]|eukprot:KXN70314.1 hypothetical protein CONCODRAFT_78924 [Conidiobolus coronatus NRRL 28638]